MSLEDVVKAICVEMPAAQIEEPNAAADGPARLVNRVMPKGTHLPEQIPIPEGRQKKVF